MSTPPSQTGPFKPLRGIRVLDLTMNLPGPLATLILSDLGAQVVKVEAPPHGDPLRAAPPLVGGTSALFHCLNRGKRFVALDLKNPRQREVFRALLARSDCLVEGFRPGVLPRLGLDPERLSAENPHLIVARLSGYGTGGPYRDRAGHDVNFLGLSGILDGQRDPDPLPIQVADVGGALLAAVSILAALLEPGPRPGRILDIPLLDAALLFAMPAHAREAAGDDPCPGRGFLEGGLPTYRLYRDADRRWVSVAALEPRFSEQLAGLFGSLDLDALCAGFSRLPRGRLFEQEPLAPCVEPVLSFSEAREHPAVRARSLFRIMKTGDQAIPLPVTPFAREDPVPDGPWASAVGADNCCILKHVTQDETPNPRRE